MNNMCDLIQYIVMPKIRYAPDIGTYTSYDIAAYDCFSLDIVEGRNARPQPGASHGRAI